jgi:hypothetical protein
MHGPYSHPQQQLYPAGVQMPASAKLAVLHKGKPVPSQVVSVVHAFEHRQISEAPMDPQHRQVRLPGQVPPSTGQATAAAASPLLDASELIVASEASVTLPSVAVPLSEQDIAKQSKGTSKWLLRMIGLRLVGDANHSSWRGTTLMVALGCRSAESEPGGALGSGNDIASELLGQFVEDSGQGSEMGNETARLLFRP